MQIIVEKVNGTKPDTDTRRQVELSIWKSLSYIVANMEPEDEMERLTPDEERTVKQLLEGFQKSGFTVKHLGENPLVLSLECWSPSSLDNFFYQSKQGYLADQIDECLSPILATKMRLSGILLVTHISNHEYKLFHRKLAKDGRW